MIGPVQQLPATITPAGLGALVRDPPDGIRENIGLAVVVDDGTSGPSTRAQP